MKIKIIVGTYGYRKNDTSPVELIDKNSDPIEVSDKEAARLIKLGVAEEVNKTVSETPVGAEETATGHLDAESLEEYTVSELKDLAGNLGLEFKSKATKDELIKLISAAEVEYPVAEDAGADNDGEEPPILNAVDPE